MDNQTDTHARSERDRMSREIMLGSGRRILLPNDVYINDLPRNFEYLLKVLAEPKAHLLVTGETGTGKETIADCLFDKSKAVPDRCRRINCAGLDDALVESELFGHRKGAFTGAMDDKTGLLELCSGGILFLDEIGWLAQRLQAKLLRFLEDYVVRPIGSLDERRLGHVQIIAATNKDPAGSIIPDLRARFDFEIKLPPLRDRAADIPWFLSQPGFWGEQTAFTRISLFGLLSMLIKRWSANARELRRYCRDMLVFDDHMILPDDGGGTLLCNNSDTPLFLYSDLDFFVSNRLHAMEELFVKKGFLGECHDHAFLLAKILTALDTMNLEKDAEDDMYGPAIPLSSLGRLILSTRLFLPHWLSRLCSDIRKEVDRDGRRADLWVACEESRPDQLRPSKQFLNQVLSQHSKLWSLLTAPASSGFEETVSRLQLSRREHEIIQLAQKGLSSPRIAVELGLSPSTVKVCLRDLRQAYPDLAPHIRPAPPGRRQHRPAR